MKNTILRLTSYYISIFLTMPLGIKYLCIPKTLQHGQYVLYCNWINKHLEITFKNLIASQNLWHHDHSSPKHATSLRYFHYILSTRTTTVFSQTINTTSTKFNSLYNLSIPWHLSLIRRQSHAFHYPYHYDH